MRSSREIARKWEGIAQGKASLSMINTVHVQGCLLNNLLPVTLGNIIGGAGLAAIYAKVYKE